MKINQHLLIASLSMAAAFFTGAADASILTYTDRTAFLSAILPGYFEDNFNDLANGDIAGQPNATRSGNSFSVTYGATPSENGIYSITGGLSVSLAADQLVITANGANIYAIGGNFFYTDVDSNFLAGGTVSAFAANGVDPNAPLTASNQLSNFFGWISSTPITSVTLNSSGLETHYGSLDNIIVADVPELNTLPLLFTGLGIIFIRRRRNLNMTKNINAVAANNKSYRKFLNIFAAILLLIIGPIQQNAWAAEKVRTIKVLAVKNPTGGVVVNADQMDIKFNNSLGKVLDSQGVTPGRSFYPSEKFDGVTGLNSSNLSYAAGLLPRGQTDIIRLKFSGTTTGAPIARNIVDQVKFTSTTPAQEQIVDAPSKVFKQNITGFTNEEYFNFSGLNGSLNLLNSSISDNLRYTINNLQVYKDLSGTNFDFDNYLNTGLSTPVYSQASVDINPGESLQISLGTVTYGSYALATADSVTVTDLSDMSFYTFDAPFSYAQTVPEAPPLLLMLAPVLFLLVRKAGKINP